MSEEAAMEAFLAMFQMIPGTENVDWETFVTEFEAKKNSGAEITLQGCLPGEVWALFGTMMFMDENGQVPEDLPMNVDVQVNGNKMVCLYTMKEQADEESAKQIAASVAESFEAPESLATLKSSIEQMAESGVDTGKVVLELKYVNADGSVIYDKAYTYAEFNAVLEPAA